MREGLHCGGLIAAAFMLLAGCRDAACPPRAPDLSAMPLLDESEKESLAAFLATRTDLRVPTSAECDCAEDIAELRRHARFGPAWDRYEPYVVRGDFNRDGEEDFAVLLVDNDGGTAKRAMLAIFDGPYFEAPARFEFRFVRHQALFATADRTGLLRGAFWSEGCRYVPRGAGYAEDCSESG